uniref:Putative secreted protein n=1 Tax=Ixodes ricinus TaxID=34613 RepID=A0A6B0UGW0_IXORI
MLLLLVSFPPSVCMCTKLKILACSWYGFQYTQLEPYVAAKDSAWSTSHCWPVAVSSASHSSQELGEGLGRDETDGMTSHCQTIRRRLRRSPQRGHSGGPRER